ncbi:hypothetical protein D3C81_769730 [compost metagenome]
MFEHADRLHFVCVDIRNIPPFLTVSDGTLSSAALEQAIAAIGLFQWQREHYRCSLAITRQHPGQLEGTGKTIQSICVNQSALGQAQLQPSGHEFA